MQKNGKSVDILNVKKLNRICQIVKQLELLAK